MKQSETSPRAAACASALAQRDFLRQYLCIHGAFNTPIIVRSAADLSKAERRIQAECLKIVRSDFQEQPLGTGSGGRGLGGLQQTPADPQPARRGMDADGNDLGLVGGGAQED